VTALAHLIAEAKRLSDLIDNGVTALRTAAQEAAQAEHTYRKARAQAWTQTDGTAKEREDAVNAITADERLARDMAEAKRLAALEALRSRRTQLSSVQTLANADRVELEQAFFGPDEGVA
jgi:hypothetical protein